jgi:SAM-dependent methyltransferase
MDIKAYLEEQNGFWENLANQWTPDNRDPVVGWYDQHEAFPLYDTVLFDGIETEGKFALEYGCGPGRNIRRFAKRFAQIDGVDISATNVEKAAIWCAEQNLPFSPFFYKNNGSDLILLDDDSYDVVFSVIAIQHINNWNVRESIYKEIFRVLKPGGWFTFQVGFGKGHPRSVDYYHVSNHYFESDFRVEDPENLVEDLTDVGFKNVSFVITDPCCDEHPKWIWVKAQNEL